MNKISKIIKRFSLLLIAVVLTFGTNIYAKSNDDNAHITMGEAKQIVDDFLQKNHPEIRFGTDEYVEYLVEQLSEGTDSVLKADPNADLMLDYASIYLYETEERQTATYGLFDNADYETLYNKTIGEMVREIKEDEENIQAIPTPLATIGPMPSYN
ncbi:MAG: hypothetical protein K2P14_06075, partial [Anaeroplasmataceae bacterium]|nr:hypothetical protein [Anaeroplasmataceae bacterium]